MDLGARGHQTFRYVLLPQIATALLAGGMLAFALSFDEIIVTLFTAGHERTLPIWFYSELFRPRERPVTNVVARLRRIPPSWVEASMDLGARGHQTFRYVLLPQIATALLAGGMLAFALSFDEIIVTLFTAGHERTLPIWFYSELFRPRERPVTNVVAVVVILVTLVPILLAYYLTRPDEQSQGS